MTHWRRSRMLEGMAAAISALASSVSPLAAGTSDFEEPVYTIAQVDTADLPVEDASVDAFISRFIEMYEEHINSEPMIPVEEKQSHEEIAAYLDELEKLREEKLISTVEYLRGHG